METTSLILLQNRYRRALSKMFRFSQKKRAELNLPNLVRSIIFRFKMFSSYFPKKNILAGFK